MCHPLFVTPYIMRLRKEQRRPLAIVYVVCYLAICLFWMSYGQLMLSANGAEASVPGGAGLTYFLVRAALLVADFSFSGFVLMLENGLRFVAWQNLIALPLVLASWRIIRQGDSFARALAEGLLITFIAMLVILPYQGHGWGYRYLHGLIGNFCILGGYGWIAATSSASREQLGAARVAVIAAAAVAVAILLPLHALQANSWVAPYRKSVAAIEGAPADIVMVDRTGLMYAADLVRNDPYLRNRPKVLDLAYLDETLIGQLCKRSSVAIFDKSLGVELGLPTHEVLPQANLQRLAELRAHLASLSCGSVLAVRSGAP
jgi:hypothetical protein